MKEIVLDAGPLIGLFYKKDTYHNLCVQGFAELDRHQVLVIVPLPIVFEVYKWLLQKTYPKFAQQALQKMEQTFFLLSLTDNIFEDVRQTVYALPDWKGSLEDATVMLSAVKYCCPIWTYNYRDFAIFQALEFWNPQAQ